MIESVLPAEVIVDASCPSVKLSLANPNVIVPILLLIVKLPFKEPEDKSAFEIPPTIE